LKADGNARVAVLVRRAFAGVGPADDDVNRASRGRVTDEHGLR
jgi:hypothetical protein